MDSARRRPSTTQASRATDIDADPFSFTEQPIEVTKTLEALHNSGNPARVVFMEHLLHTLRESGPTAELWDAYSECWIIPALLNAANDPRLACNIDTDKDIVVSDKTLTAANRLKQCALRLTCRS